MSGWIVGSGIPQEPWVLRADSCGYTHGIGAQPVAAFSGTPITSTAFQFQNQSLDACRYFWSFGDGGTSTLLSPQHSYSTPGTYTVQLVSCAADRCDTTSQQVIVYPCGSVPGDTVQPVAAMQVMPISPYGSFSLTSQSTEYCSLLWLFGDGNSSTLANPQHQYQLSGTYTISHIAFRGALADTVTQQITVLYACGMAPADTLEPVAAMQVTPVTAGSFTFTSQSANYCTLLWHFGDGDTSTAANPQHTYQQSGTYTVMHIATFGAKADTVTQQLTVLYPCGTAPADTTQPVAAMQLSLISGWTYDFTSQSANYCTLLWHFGDGDTSTAANPQHTYQQPGTYTVMHIATAGAKADTVSQQVSVVSGLAGSLNQQAAVQLFPNPAANEVIVQCQLPESIENANLLLFDVLGRLVHNQALEQPQGRNTVQLSKLGSGIYYYKVMAGSQEMAKGKLIVARNR